MLGTHWVKVPGKDLVSFAVTRLYIVLKLLILTQLDSVSLQLLKLTILGIYK